MVTMMKEAEGTGAGEASVSELGELGAREGHVEPPVAAKDASRVIPAKAGIHGHSVSELETLSSWVPASAHCCPVFFARGGCTADKRLGLCHNPVV
jgi:hypothetical protein